MLAAVLAIVGAFTAGDIHGHRSEATTWRAKVEEARADAAEAARITERKQQGMVNDALQQQYWDLAAVNAGLHDDIERLRQRPSRPLPGAAGAACTGANGAQLSGEDARFLARYAALAAESDAALAACYRFVDAVSGGG